MICLFTDMCIYVCAFVLMSLSAYARVYLCVCAHLCYLYYDRHPIDAEIN